MGLTRNGWASGAPMAFAGAGLAALSRPMTGSIANARAFGAKVSYPQGYGNETALKMPVNTGAVGAWRARAASDLTLEPVNAQIGDLAMDGVSDLTLVASTRFSSSLALPAESGLDMGLVQSMQMALPLDILARPSAFDIAQEVWNSRKADYAAEGTLAKSVADAERAAKLAAALSA